MVFAALLASLGAARCWALDASAMQAMVIVEGDVGRGSAFVVRMGAKTYLVTNSHVVRGNRNLKFKNLRNIALTPGALEIADQVDAVRAEVNGVANVLEMEPQIDKIKIGDEVVVAGNSEGEGVVREIPGKIVGIGPDRIEVDAEFVPGNSGSPILLKSTGKVIGVATYMKIPPRGGRNSGKSPFSLNEIRRFGYRIDTVAKWINPPTKDRLVLEGLKLSEMENLMTSIVAVMETNAAFVSKWGASSFVTKENAQRYPAFAALSQAIDNFCKQYAAAKSDDEKGKTTAVFFDRLTSIVTDDVRGLKENQFSGYYSVQLEEALHHCKEFSDWSDGTMAPAYREAWTASKIDPRIAIARQASGSGGASKPPLDASKLNFVLSDSVAAGEPPDYCHHVTYPTEMQPPNLDNIFWVIEDPNGGKRSFEMHKAGLRVRTTINGSYRVYVEYRGTDKPRVVSNVAEVKFNVATTGANAAAAVATNTKARENVVAETQDFSITGDGAAIATLTNDGTAFSNRDYVWKNVPANLNGRSYTKLGGGNSARITVHGKRDTTLEVLTAIDQPGLKLPGWEQTLTSFIYTDGKDTRVVLFRKKLAAGEDLEIPRGNWSGVLVLMPQ